MEDFTYEEDCRTISHHTVAALSHAWELQHLLPRYLMPHSNYITNDCSTCSCNWLSGLGMPEPFIGCKLGHKSQTSFNNNGNSLGGKTRTISFISRVPEYHWGFKAGQAEKDKQRWVGRVWEASAPRIFVCMRTWIRKHGSVSSDGWVTLLRGRKSK